MIEVREFQAKDLTLMDPPVLTQSELDSYVAPPGLAWSAIEGGRVLICGGAVGIPPVGRAWVLTSKAMSGRPVLMHRLVREGLSKLAEHFDVLEATVRSDFRRGRIWAERLGFERDGAANESHERYVKHDRC